jgi:ApbE superfamily uncharacterized protein (UPF0280 family)
MNKNNVQHIDIEETHIRLISDILNHNLENYILKIRQDLKRYIYTHQDFINRLEPLDNNLKTKSEIVNMMDYASRISNVGPMATVAGTISEMSLNYLIKKDTKLSSVENGGDIAIINNRSMVCGIYSNTIKDIGFKLKPRTKPLGICTSSSTVGHSISFGNSESVTVVGSHASICDGLATRIANDVYGESDEDGMEGGLESAEGYREYFDGVLITIGDLVGTVGRLPKIVSTEPFDIDY